MAAWQKAVRAQVMKFFGGREGTIGKSIELHGGKDYTAALSKALEGLGIDVVPAMVGKGVGVQIGEYAKGYQRPQTIGGFGSAKGFPKPPTEPTVPEAVVKAQSEVSNVAATQGQRPAKEVKSELVKRIEEELAKLPEPSGEVTFGKPATYSGTKRIEVHLPGQKGTLRLLQRGDLWKVELSDYFLGIKTPIKLSQILADNMPLSEAKAFAADQMLSGNKWHPEKPVLEGDKITKQITVDWSKWDKEENPVRETPETVQIDIPGDGSFSVPKTRFALERMLARAKKLDTKPSAYPIPKPSTEKLAGPGSPAYGQGPDHEVLGLDLGSPTWNRIQRRYQNFFGGLGQLFKRREIKQDLQSLSNAADNLPRVAGLRAGDSIRVRTSEQQQNALTFVMQALKMSGEGLSEENAARLGELEFAGDPTGYLQVKQAEMETLAQQFANEGKKLEAQAALEASKHMRFAREHFNELKPIAELAKRKFDRQLFRERANGIDVDYENWYVPQRHEIDLIPASDRPIVLGESRGGGPAGTFKKAKVYEDYASAIEAGFIPRDFNLANLLEHRVTAGERLITGRGFFDAMREIPDPVDGEPIVKDIPRRIINRPDGSVDVQESIPIGYTKQQVMGGASVAVHNGYRRLVDALTARSQLAESAVVGTLQNIAAIEKHLMLALDTFHASRTMQAEFALTGRVSVGSRQRLGRALFEYGVGDLDAAVQKGEITQEMADYIRTPQQMEINGQQQAISPHALLNFGIRNGLNIARWGDALYKDWLRNMPVTGEVNRWVFDKLTRSAVAHGFLAEFERMAKSRPEMTATQVARKVASDINVMFGNLGKQSIFRNPSLRSITQVLFLAPQWVESLARREGRAALQLGEAAITGRAPATVGKGIGTGLALYFLATQITNLITRGQFTWQNKEKGHKLDAWIPGGQNGFFISPLSVFGEITHDILRYAQTKPDILSAISQIGANKLGPLGRAIEVMATGRDPLTSERIVGSGRRAVRAALSAAPVPITLSQGLRTAANIVAPGVVAPPPPGGLQRQAMASAGLKAEPVGTAQSQIYQMADDWKRHSGNAKYQAEVERRLKEDFGPSDYRDMRAALNRGDTDQARAAYQELRQSGKTPRTIRQTMQHPHPFTGSATAERRFRDSLSAADRETYNKALEERRELYHRFLQMLHSQPKEQNAGSK